MPAVKTWKKKPVSVVAADLVPVASEMDDRGNLIGTHQTVPAKGPGSKAVEEVEFPVGEWLTSTPVNEAETDTAKRVLQQCVQQVHQVMRRKMPAVKTWKKKPVSVVAEVDFEKGELLIPLYCRRSASIVVEGDALARDERCVGVDVEWTEPNVRKHFEELGVEEAKQHHVALWVKPEVRLPQTNDGLDSWTGQEDLHPFWTVHRQTEGDEINCKICKQWVHVNASIDWSIGLNLEGAKLEGLENISTYVGYLFVINTPPNLPHSLLRGMSTGVSGFTTRCCGELF